MATRLSRHWTVACALLPVYAPRIALATLSRLPLSTELCTAYPTPTPNPHPRYVVGGETWSGKKGPCSYDITSSCDINQVTNHAHPSPPLHVDQVPEHSVL